MHKSRLQINEWQMQKWSSVALVVIEFSPYCHLNFFPRLSRPEFFPYTENSSQYIIFMQNAVAPADMKPSRITCTKKMNTQFNPDINENIHRYITS